LGIPPIMSFHFLNDETGSRTRGCAFELKDKIDFSYSKENGIKHVWIQAYHPRLYDPNLIQITLTEYYGEEVRNKK